MREFKTRPTQMLTAQRKMQVGNANAVTRNDNYCDARADKATRNDGDSVASANTNSCCT
jgi:hypothetical protein